MEHHELHAWLRLTLTEGVGPDAAQRLLRAFGDAPRVFASSEARWREHLSARQAAALQEVPAALAVQVARTQQWLREAPATRALWTWHHPAYPAVLRDLHDAPPLLYAQGRDVTDFDALVLSPALAVVGSRNPTPQGAQNARDLAHALCARGLCIVSGLALGIDGAAHLGALDAATEAPQRCLTVAVVGTGLDRVYPRQHQALAQDIASHGVLLSEYPLGAPPLAAHFPRRNRLIAALGRGTLVVEAAIQSGSLITAGLALDLGREVFAVPGSIHAPQSRGCHALIRQGAKLVETAHDVLEELSGLDAAHTLSHDVMPAADRPTDMGYGVAEGVLTCLGYDPVDLDRLQARSGLDASAVQAALFTLELQGRVARLPGGLFQRLG
jgi:DNA processing protein